MSKKETREVRAGADVCVETRDDGGVKVEGHAAVFDERTNIGDMFDEMIERGAFRKAIKNDDVRLLINHEGTPLARTQSGTLKLSEDSRGLRIKAELDGSDPDVKAIAPKMARGDLSQMSIGFTMRGGKEEWDETGDTPLRKIRQVGALMDVSIVTFPAYPTTDVGLRALQKIKNSHAVANRARRKRMRQGIFAARTKDRKPNK